MKPVVLLTVLLLNGSSAYAQCQLAASSVKDSDGGYAHYCEFETTGDKYIDQLFEDQIRLGLVIFSLHGIDLYFYSDQNNVNAWAIDKATGLDILSFELSLIAQKRAAFPERPDQPCIAILAHELGHALQFSRGGAERLKDFQKELHADFLAGYYMGYKYCIQQANDADADVFFTLFFQLGDDKFYSEAHHGTPSQRKRAALAGYRYGKEMTPIDMVYPKGVQYVSTFQINDGY